MTTTTKRPARLVAQEAERALAQKCEGETTLGHFVLWNVQDVLIDEDVLRAGCATWGLGALTPYPIRPKTAMKRAITQLLATSQLVRRVADTKQYSLYVIKDEFQVPGRDHMPDLDWRTDLKMCWYKDEGNDPDRALAFDDEVRGAYYRPVVAKFLHSYVAADIAELLRGAVVRNRGISLRHNGGIYFLPATPENAALLSNLRSFMTWLASECAAPACFFSAFAVPASSDGVSDLSRHVNHALKAELKKVADDIRGIEERVGKTTVAPTTVTKYFNQVEALNEKALLYVDLVRFQADEVTELVRELSARCHKLIEVTSPDPFAGV